jgi:hypothetical protein
LSGDHKLSNTIYVIVTGCIVCLLNVVLANNHLKLKSKKVFLHFVPYLALFGKTA